MEFKRLTRLLADYPEIGSPRTRGRRGFAMSNFPYTVIYRLGTDEIKILVVKHDNQRPGYGRSRS